MNDIIYKKIVAPTKQSKSDAPYEESSGR